jgi:hypothetical protein
MSLIAIALIMIGTYFLFRQLQLTTRLETEQGILRDRVRDATSSWRNEINSFRKQTSSSGAPTAA